MRRKKRIYLQLSRSISLQGSSMRTVSWWNPRLRSKRRFRARWAISFLGILMVVSMGEVFSEASILSIEITEGI